MVLIPLSLSKFAGRQRKAGKQSSNRGVTTQLVWLQKPEGVKTFMSRGLSLCGRVGARLASMPEISILGGMNLAGSSTLKLTWLLVPSMVEDFCMPK